jgi:hypothetical protein
LKATISTAWNITLNIFKGLSNVGKKVWDFLFGPKVVNTNMPIIYDENGNQLTINPTQSAEGTGYATGGYTGIGGKYQPAGIVHAGEYVIPQWLVRKYPDLVKILENTRKRGYAEGGPVETAIGYFTGGGVSKDIKTIANTLQKMATDMQKTNPEMSKQLEIIAEKMGADKPTGTTEPVKTSWIDKFVKGAKSLATQFGTLFLTLQSVQEILQPVTTIMMAAFDVLKPIVDSALKPFVNLLKTIGVAIGNILVPLLEPVVTVLQVIFGVLKWGYNSILRPIGQGLYVLFAIVGNAFNVLYNIVSGVVEGLTFGLIKMGTKQIKSMDAILKKANEKVPELKGTGGTMSTTQQYSSTVTRSGPETVNNTFIVNANDSFVFNSEDKFKTWLAKTIQDLVNQGTIVIGG